MRAMKKDAKKSVLPKLAKKIGDTSLNSACALWYHQPKVPAALLRKDK